MAVVVYKTFSFIVSLLVCIVSVQNSRLNVPRVLLPIFNDFLTNFTLETTEGGCYKWTTTRIDLIHLTLLDIDPELRCSGKIVVSTITKERARNIAVVLAENVHTRQVLRCDVIVDVIHSLNIVTTTRELFMEEAPEAFEVRSYDSQGNEFSSLEGVEFDWSLICMAPTKDLSVLRFLTFKESPYETPPSVQDFEEENKRGHIVLLEGVKTGSAKVQVRLNYAEYASIKVEEVLLSVVANLIIVPADVYLMVGDVVQFKIIHMNNGRMEQIELPNSQYYLDVESRAVADPDKDTGEVTGLKEGNTRVILHDRNVDENDPGLKLPAANLNVVTPAYMTLSILPHRNWAILLSEHHDIVAEIFSSNDHRLHLGPGVELHTQVADLFHVQQRTKNGSWITGWAKEEGTALVQGILEAVMHRKLGRIKLNPPIAVNTEMLVFPRITVVPSEVILPWDFNLKPKYEIQLHAFGGDGKFLWSSSNHSLGVVTQTGVVRTHTHGYFEVSASMMRNHHNRQNAIFHILPPTRLEIVEFIMEAEVGAIIFLHVALFADAPGKKGEEGSQIPFTQCQELPFKVKPSDTNFIQNKSAIIPPVGISCANIAIVGLAVGTSKITVTYYKDGKPLQDSVTVSAHKPLGLLHPRNCEIVLAVGTSLHVIFSGGPRPVIGRPSEHKRTITSNNITIVEAEDITDSQSIPTEDLTIINVLCLKLGESVVTLSITNVPLLPNCRNEESVAKVKVICGKPRAVYLQPEIKVADVHSCPMDLSADRVVVQSYKDVELDVAVKDENARRFLNISSLKFKWTIEPASLGLLGSPDGVFSRNRTEGIVIYANRSYQTVIPRAEMGIIDVTAKIVGYRQEVLKANRVTSEWPEFLDETEKGEEAPELKASISLYLVDDTIVTPNVTSIYNHPGNKKKLSVKQGSGYYEVGLSSPDIAEVKYLEGSRQIEILPISVGDLTITVIDLCLVSQPAVVLVSVVSVSIIRVEMSDKVELSKCIACIVRLYDDTDNLLSVPDWGMIELRTNLENEIISVKRLREDENNPWPVGEIHYVVTGLELGDTKLHFSIGAGDHEVVSAPMDVQVFPPLKIYPRNATLILGATLQLTSKGGPQPDSNIEYTVVVEGIADVSTGGLAQGLALGHTKVHARALGINPTTGQRVIYSKDAIDLQVIPIAGIKISIPLSRFRVGATIPAWASGLPEQLSPMILGTVDPPFRFEWTVDDTDVVKLHGIFHETGVEYESDDTVSIRLHGLVPGRTTLRLNAIVSGPAADCPDHLHTVFSTSLEIEVFEGLELINPEGMSGSTILMAPRSKLQLQTNLDAVCKLKYSLPVPGETSDDSFTSDQKSLSIPNPVITITESGLLQSFGTMGRGMVVISSIDFHGLRQTISLVVEVRPVHYMMLNVISSWRVQTLSPVQVIPLGTEFEVRATYHDNKGEVFTAGSPELKLRSTRFDLVRIRPGADNSSFFVSTKKPGYTILKVWADGLQKTADYAKLHISSVITPVMDHLTTGDILCVWTPVVSRIKQVGRWSTSERNLVVIDPETGVGRVAGVRGGQVAITHSFHPGAALQLQVIPANNITMYPDYTKNVTNALDGQGYAVPLVISTDKSVDKTNNLLNGWQCRDELLGAAIFYPFKCRLEFVKESVTVDPERVFMLRPSFDIDTGRYNCYILPGPEHGPNISVLNSNVSVWAELDGTDDIKADPVELRFIPAIYLERQLMLDDITYSAKLTIYGLDYVLDEVTVTAIDESLIYIYEAERSAPNLLTHEIRLLDYHWKLDELDEPMSILISSKLTEQTIKVHVRTKGGSGPQCSVAKRSPLVAFFYTYRHLLAIIASMLIILIVTFYVYASYVQPVVNVNVTPNRCPPSQTAQYSPRTTCYNPCVAVAYPRRPSTPTNCSPNMYMMNREPVYGDPNSFYSTSPELRRNRRLM